MKRETLQFHISEAVRVCQLTGAYLTMGPLHNQDLHPAFETLRAQLLQEVLQNLTPEKLNIDPILNGFRTLHEALGVPDRKNPSAPEALLRYLLKTGGDASRQSGRRHLQSGFYQDAHGSRRKAISHSYLAMLLCA